MVRIRELLAEGALGEVRAVTAALLDLGIYPISFIWDVLGAPTSIQATARLIETGADSEVATIMTHAGGAVSTSLSSSRAVGPNAASILGTEARIDIDRVWYTPTTFRVTGPDGTVRETYTSEVDGRGMQYQAFAAEGAVAAGDASGSLLPLPVAESVAIMGTLDEIRAQIGVSYPGEERNDG
jgi:predicted dehydrogenase